MDFGNALNDLGSGPLRFLYSWLLPSTITAAIYLLVVAPPALADGVFRADTPTSLLASTAVVAVVTVTISTAVGLLSLPIYRFLEGYTMPRWIARRFRRRQLVRRRRLQNLARRQRVQTRADLIAEQLDMYPERAADVLPTRLGNGLRAFERYGDIRFGLDSQALWYELVAAAPQPLRTDIDEARAPVDFFVSAMVHLLLLSLASWATGLVAGGASPWIVGVAAALLVRVAYTGAVRNVGEYGSAVKALINLGRCPLATALGLEMPSRAAEERSMWEAVTALTIWQAEGSTLHAALDKYRSQRPGP